MKASEQQLVDEWRARGAKPDYLFIPPLALEAVARVLTAGQFVERRSPHGWKRRRDGKAKALRAAYRHLAKYMQGTMRNRQSGELHLAHAVARLLHVLGYELGDDRRRSPGEAVAQLAAGRFEAMPDEYLGANDELDAYDPDPPASMAAYRESAFERRERLGLNLRSDAQRRRFREGKSTDAAVYCTGTPTAKLSRHAFEFIDGPPARRWWMSPHPHPERVATNLPAGRHELQCPGAVVPSPAPVAGSIGERLTAYGIAITEAQKGAPCPTS